jgi:hypothetical protein
MARSSSSLILNGVAAVLVLVAMIQPIWSISMNASTFGNPEGRLTYYGDHRTQEVSVGSSLQVTEIRWYSDPRFPEPNMANVFTQYRFLLLAILLLLVLSLTLSLVAHVVPATRTLTTIKLLLGIGAVILAVVAPIYLANALPPAVNADLDLQVDALWGSTQGGVVSVSWGPMGAWALTIVAAILAFLALLLDARDRPVAAVRVHSP